MSWFRSTTSRVCATLPRRGGVKAASVSPALHRLADLGLVDYSRREYVRLTEEGERRAMQVLTRHNVLSRFFQKFLLMAEADAERDACAMEHSLSPEATDRLVRFLEYVTVCPEGSEAMLNRFHRCSRVQEGVPPCAHACPKTEGLGGIRATSLAELDPGSAARVLQVDASGAVRQRLLDMGLLPGVEIAIIRHAPGGDPIWIQVYGSQIALRRKEAESVLVSPLTRS